MTAHREPDPGAEALVVVELAAPDIAPAEPAAAGAGGDDDGLTLGRPPRPPLARRTKRLLTGGVVALAAVVAVGAFVVTRPDAAPSTPGAGASPTAQSSAGFAAGPVLVSVDGKDALQPPGLPGLGTAVQPVVLDPAPEIVALLTAALPGFRDVHGGRIPGNDGRFGVYLAGDYDGAGGAPVSVSIYTLRAPGTTFGADQYVSRTRFDREYTVRTDVSVFTGDGWWVHAVSLGPDDPATARTGEVAKLLPLAENPALVAT